MFSEILSYASSAGLILVVAFVLSLPVILALIYRTVVPTNEVHIVQRASATTAYGRDTSNGNTYYKWPSWVPKIGVLSVTLPLSVFDQNLENYDAYDSGRLPFVLDVKAFFRIETPDLAAQRVSSFQELKEQLKSILQGSIRTILASESIEKIMEGRAIFGEKFTTEVNQQLKEWGVTTVKSIELMDIRDARDSKVIDNIMAKKKSQIDMESRTEVAKNKNAAETAEIENQKQVDLNRQNAKKEVGIREAEVTKEVGIAKEKSTQSIHDEAKTTTEKKMAVQRVEEVQTAEIEKEVQIVQAEQNKAVSVTNAEAAREVTVKNAEASRKEVELASLGKLDASKNDAEGVKVTSIAQAEATRVTMAAEADGVRAKGLAAADAETAMQKAPVTAQIELAREIGNNEGYQKYLISIRVVEAQQEVGKAQANAIGNADTKFIINAASPGDGMSKISELVSSGSGQNIGAMLEGLSQTDMGRALIDKFMNGAALGLGAAVGAKTAGAAKTAESA